MKLSKVSDYAVRAVVNMAMQENTGLVTIKQIAEDEDIPTSFLAKVIQSLVSAGIVKGYRGRSGGLSLSRKADDITMKDIIEAVNGPILMTRCLVEHRKCHGNNHCAVHLVLEETQEVLVKILNRYSVADLVQRHRTMRSVSSSHVYNKDDRPVNIQAA